MRYGTSHIQADCISVGERNSSIEIEANLLHGAGFKCVTPIGLAMRYPESDSITKPSFATAPDDLEIERATDSPHLPPASGSRIQKAAEE